MEKQLNREPGESHPKIRATARAGSAPLPVTAAIGNFLHCTALLCVLLLVPQMLVAADWSVRYQKGLDAFHQKQWATAILYLNESIRERPDEKAGVNVEGLRFVDYFPYLYRGVAHARSGNIRRAIEDLERSEQTGEVARARNDSGAQLLMRESLATLRTTARDEAMLAQGVAFYRNHEYRKAMEKFAAINRTSSVYIEAQRYIGIAQRDRARDSTSIAGISAPDSSVMEYDTGIRLFEQHDLAAAERRFHSVLRRQKDHAGARAYLTKIMHARMTPRGTRDQASVDTVLLDQAMELYRAGEMDRAQEMLARIDITFPGNGAVSACLDSIAQNEEKCKRGIAAYCEGDYPTAIHLLSEATRSNKGNARIYGFLASAYAAAYLLWGTEDDQLSSKAVEAYNRARQVDGTYTLDARYTSPRIIAMLNSR
jgi:tetratricopeptide (TPR) repeat protein